MATIRLHPPADGTHGTITVHGRTYTCANGAVIDVPDFDALVMISNGWVAMDKNGVGATASRPANPTKGMTFLDSTVGAVIKFDGIAWRNTITGAAV